MVKFLMKRLQQKEKYLKSFGVTFMFSRVTYLHYYVVKCILAILLTCIFYRIGAWMAMVGLCIGFYIVDLIIHISNTSDNDNMLADIESIYDIMRIQARAGVYMQDSLMDCYSAARSPRLKAALLHMCNQLSTTGTIEEAILEFESRFSNRHVDVLGIVLSQSQSSGKMVQILSDMSEQINQVRHSRSKKEEGKLERKIEMVQLLIFIGVLAIGMYAMGTEILELVSF